MRRLLIATSIFFLCACNCGMEERAERCNKSCAVVGLKVWSFNPGNYGMPECICMTRKME